MKLRSHILSFTVFISCNDLKKKTLSCHYLTLIYLDAGAASLRSLSAWGTALLTAFTSCPKLKEYTDQSQTPEWMEMCKNKMWFLWYIQYDVRQSVSQIQCQRQPKKYDIILYKNKFTDWKYVLKMEIDNISLVLPHFSNSPYGCVWM